MFEIPIGLFIFKRTDKSVQIMRKIAKVKPKKVYIISDAGRTDDEKEMVAACRSAVEQAVDWPCELVKLYETENKGCYHIGTQAMEIFKEEPMCIFLEDDNEPEETFFEYCREMLIRYEKDDRILWVCGTNYMGEYCPEDGSDYVFTRHMLPCGWASWGEKFLKYYEYDFQHLTKEGLQKTKRSYKDGRLFRYDQKNWFSEVNNKANGRYASWDYHMNFSLRYHDKLGIAPRVNQIKNIGVDSFSAHGGSSMENLLTSRFCMLPTGKLTFPLKHAESVHIDQKFEKRTADIIMPPRSYYFKIFLRRLIPIPRSISIRKSLKAGRLVKK